MRIIDDPLVLYALTVAATLPHLLRSIYKLVEEARTEAARNRVKEIETARRLDLRAARKEGLA